ncbi:MAG: amidohydrolase [Acidimicrobiia bacterium]
MTVTATTIDRTTPICDAHHHLWDLNGSLYVATDLNADIASSGYQVPSSVYVECGAWYRDSGPEHLRPVGETEWVADNADPITRGIVGYADLRLGSAVGEVLDAHLSAGHGKFRGIRHMATWDASPQIRPVPPFPERQMLLADNFRAGFAELGSRGLSFDAWVYFPQLPEVADLARAFPDTTIVLNHLGGPIALGPYNDRGAVLAEWRRLIPAVAKCPNVVMKLGGIGMPIYGMGWHKQPADPTVDDVVAAWGDPIRFCVEQFGADRCLFESNFPVDKFSMPYATLWDAFSVIAAGASSSERTALFNATARRVYRLP